MSSSNSNVHHMKKELTATTLNSQVPNVVKIDKSRDIRIEFSGKNLDPLIDNLIDKGNLQGKLSGIHYLTETMIMLTLTQRTDMLQLHDFLKTNKHNVSVISSFVIEPESIFVLFKGVHVLITEEQFYEILKTSFLEPVSVKWLKDKRGLPRNERIAEFNHKQFANTQLKNYLRIGDDIVYLTVCRDHEDQQVQSNQSVQRNTVSTTASSSTQPESTHTHESANVPSPPSTTQNNSTSAHHSRSLSGQPRPNTIQAMKSVKQESTQNKVSCAKSPSTATRRHNAPASEVEPWPIIHAGDSSDCIQINSDDHSEVSHAVARPILKTGSSSSRKDNEMQVKVAVNALKRGSDSTDSDGHGSPRQRSKSAQPIVLSSVDRATVMPDTSRWTEKPNKRDYDNSSIFLCIAYHTRSFDPKKRSKYISRKTFDDLILRYTSKYPQSGHWDGSVDIKHFTRFGSLFNLRINAFKKECGDVKPVFISSMVSEDNLLLIDYKDSGQCFVIVNFDMYTTSFMCKFCGMSFPRPYSGMLHRKNKVCRRRNSNDADDEGA